MSPTPRPHPPGPDRRPPVPLNARPQAGRSGEPARKKAEWLLKQGMVDMTGSDVHRQIVFERSLDLAPKKADALRTLIELSRTDPTL